MSGWKTAQGEPQESRLQGPPQRAQGRSPGAGPHLAQTARPRAEGTLFLQTLAAACDLPPRGHPEQLWTRAPDRTSRAGRPGPDTPPWASNGSNATALSLSLSCLGEATVAQGNVQHPSPLKLSASVGPAPLSVRPHHAPEVYVIKDADGLGGDASGSQPSLTLRIGYGPRRLPLRQPRV